MINKTYNKVSDFLEDDSFKNWVKKQKLSDETFWDYWLENNPDKKHIAMEAKDIILGIRFTPNLISEEKLNLEWNKLASRIDNNNSNRKKIYKSISVAASLILISFLAIYFFSENRYTKYSTGYGETLDLKLKDGSTVTLNSNSSIYYSKNNPRKVWLKGEAFFEVDKKHNTNAKFWVETNDLEVEVYGTVFNVNTRKEKTQVYLQEGSIWLALNNGDTRKMIPGNFISYSSKKNKIIEEKEFVSSIENTSWKDGKLIFENYTLEKALNKIAETYGVTFKYKDSKTQKILITGTVPTYNLDICLNAIKKSTDISIKKENGNLVVYKN